jgi:hypothetical protein
MNFTFVYFSKTEVERATAFGDGCQGSANDQLRNKGDNLVTVAKSVSLGMSKDRVRAYILKAVAVMVAIGSRSTEVTVFVWVFMWRNSLQSPYASCDLSIEVKDEASGFRQKSTI